MQAIVRRCFFSLSVCALILSTVCLKAQAASIELIDDNGRAVLLAAPARRVVSLSAQITEIIFAAGGGHKIVATVNASDFPPDARKLPRIGDGLEPDTAKIAPYNPDLMIGWLAEQIAPMEALNIPMFISAPESLAEIADSVETFGTMLGTSAIARPRADALRQTLDMLAHTKSSRATQTPPVRVFIQAGTNTDYALGDDHLLTDVITLCGGTNIFGESASNFPKVSPQSVIAGKPDLVLVGRPGAGNTPVTDPGALAYWKSAGLPAASNGHVLMMDADILYRPGPRLIEAAGHLCEAIARARP